MTRQAKSRCVIVDRQVWGTNEQPMAYPPCFQSQADYDAYMEQLQAAGPPGASFCWDCTPAFKALKLAEGQCEHPETVFIDIPADDSDLDVGEDDMIETVGVR